VLAVRASRGLSEEYARVRIPPGRTLTGLAFSRGRPHASRDSLAVIDQGGQRGWNMETEDRGSHVVIVRMPVPLDLAPADAPTQSGGRLGAAAAGYRALFSVPLTARQVIYGALSLYYREPMDFTEEQVQLATMFADQAALAIDNARLHEQAQQAAILEERQRLARELHDAVTQTLFSTALIADTLPELWATDPAEGRLRLEDLRRLTRGALAEMRSLLIELRPGALTELPLPTLLRQLAEAAAGRTRIDIEVQAQGAATEVLPPDVQVALYRIAQEALSNIEKHARAAHVSIDFSHVAGRGLKLSIADDGVGFDPAQIPPGHLGVRIMRERADAIGAQLCIASQPGQGARIETQWTAERERR
jgi:signal transduction histidine kinase